MPDIAHRETDEILKELDIRLHRLYQRTNKNIQSEIDALVTEIYLDEENATQKQRLKHAEKHGKNEIVKIVVDALLGANKKTVEYINEIEMGYYRVNFKSAIDDIITQIKDSMDAGGD